MHTFKILSILFFFTYQIPGIPDSLTFVAGECKVMMTSINESYDGECKKGLANGKGKAKGTDEYDGQFRDGLPHGAGTYTWANGEVYTGGWKKGLKEGEGQLTKVDGLIIKGFWIKDEYIGADKEPFQVLQKGPEILRLNFRRVDEISQKIELIFVQNHAQLPVRITQVNGDFLVLKPNTTLPNFIVQVRDFPFQGHIQFDVPGTLSNTVISNVDLEFRISQQGAWVVTVEMLASN
jgi:hypothetical protein